MKNTLELAAVTTWINVNEAKAIKAKLIAEGKVDKKNIALSSYRWADLKDKTKGYICRVMVVKGLLPDMEVADTKSLKKVKKSKKNAAKFVTEINTGNSVTDSHTMTYAPYLPEITGSQTA